MLRGWTLLVAAVFIGAGAFLATYFLYFRIYQPDPDTTDVLSPLQLIELFFVFVFISVFLYLNLRPTAFVAKIKSLPGVSALESIVERAAKLRKPVLFVPGQLSIGIMSNIAGMEFLRRLAILCARESVPLHYITRDGALMAAAREVVKWAFQHEGKLDEYRPERIFLLSPEQFAFAASAGAYMARERPHLIVCFGYFRAESLYLFESARAIGAVVIGATDEPTQMPFLLTCCHYSMIGEELYAAGALAGDTLKLRAAIRVSDIWRVAVLGILIGGMILNGIAHYFELDGILEFLSVLSG